MNSLINAVLSLQREENLNNLAANRNPMPPPARLIDPDDFID